MFDGEGSQSDGANYSLGNQRSSPQFPRCTLRAPARHRSASWGKKCKIFQLEGEKTAPQRVYNVHCILYIFTDGVIFYT